MLVLRSAATREGGEGQENILLARLRPGGTPAASFGGGDGLVVEPVGSAAPFAAVPNRLAAAPGGGVVLAGRGGPAPGPDWPRPATRPPARSTSFGRGGDDGDGVASAGTAGESCGANDVAVQHGRVVAVGDAGSPFSVVCFTADGLLDVDFAPGGAGGDGTPPQGRHCSVAPLRRFHPAVLPSLVFLPSEPSESGPRNASPAETEPAPRGVVPRRGRSPQRRSNRVCSGTPGDPPDWSVSTPPAVFSLVELFGPSSGPGGRSSAAALWRARSLALS